MPKEVTLGVSKAGAYPREYRVFWKEDRRYDEGKAYYTDDLVDAGLTLAKVAREASNQGYRVRISGALITKDALKASAGLAGGLTSESNIDVFLEGYHPGTFRLAKGSI